MQKWKAAVQSYWKQDTAGVMNVLLGFLGAFLLTRIRLHALHAPLALALLLAGQLMHVDTLGMFGGIVVGSMIGGNPMWHTVGTACVYWALMRVLPYFRQNLNRRMQSLLFVLCGLLALPLTLQSGVVELLYGLCSVVLALLCSSVWMLLINSIRTVGPGRVFTLREQAAFAFAYGCFLVSVREIVFFGWSLSVTLLIAATFVVITIRGVYGAAASTLWTSMLALYTDANPLLIGSIAFAALLGAMLRTRGRAFVFLSFVLSSVLFETYAETSAYTMDVQNLLSGALFSFLLPRKWLDRLSAFVNLERQAEDLRNGTIQSIERHASEQIVELGDLLKGFSSMFCSSASEENAVMRWTIQAARGVCRDCKECGNCWSDAKEMQRTIVRLAKEADAGRRVTTTDPMHPTCERFRELCSAVVLSYQQALAREAVVEQAKQASAFANKQFSGVGDALIDRAQRLRTTEREQAEQRSRVEERLISLGVQIRSFDWQETQENRMFRVVLKRPLHVKRDVIASELERACGFRLRTVRVAVEKQTVTFVLEQDAKLHASMRVSKSEEHGAVSGDATGECRLSGGRVCYALSDGMGRGKMARKESEAAIELLFRLYRAGIDRSLIYDTVNRMLLAHNENETYATLDAVSIDLNTGEAELLKYGAPPSFLLRNGSITPIDGEALPCGILAEAKPSVIRIRLQANDRLVFCTDGVQDVLPNSTEETLEQLSKSKLPIESTLLKLAESRKGTDDMTVMVIHVA